MVLLCFAVFLLCFAMSSYVFAMRCYVLLCFCCFCNVFVQQNKNTGCSQCHLQDPINFRHGQNFMGDKVIAYFSCVPLFCFVFCLF